MNRVRIYDLAGVLARDLSGRTDRIEWDGLDKRQRSLAGAVHLARGSIDGGAAKTLLVLSKRSAYASP